jgi:hypothetical protein
MFGVALLALVPELPAGTGAKSGTKHGLKYRIQINMLFFTDTHKHWIFHILSNTV